jgi:hypothetical protein
MEDTPSHFHESINLHRRDYTTYNPERQGGGEEANLRWLTLGASITYQAAIPVTKSCYPATPPPDPTPHVKPKQGGTERLLLAFAHLRQQRRFLEVISGSIDDAKYLVVGKK